MDTVSIQSSYARWAPIYDRTFGVLTGQGRKKAVEYINKRHETIEGGRLLEVGVGTGLSLRHYEKDIEVSGIDFSEEMLEKARKKCELLELSNTVELRQMDARELDFPDNQFDTIAAMHVLSVVPDPEKVMSEITRVLKPGGQVIVTNHFARTKGILSAIERMTAPMANLIGWHSDFEKDRILGEAQLVLVDESKIPPLGMMTFLVLEKQKIS